MTKRFQIIGENYTNIDMSVFIVCREDDCCFEVYESKEDAQIVCDKLNNLVEENEQLKQLIDYHLNVCKTEKKKITDMYDWGMPQRQGKTVSNELLLKYIGAIEVLEQIKKELKGDV